MDPLDPNDNPLGDDPLAWERAIEAAGPAAMLVRIESRMSPLLRSRLGPEDLWQETLLHAWRDRTRHQWRGLRSFRSWLLEIAENRIRDAADREGAEKRGGGHEIGTLRGAAHDTNPSTASDFRSPVSSTTPSRQVVHRERAEQMRAALDSLPEGLREVVRRRLFEEQGLDEIGAAMGLSHAAVKHRLRKGSTMYRERLAARIESRASDPGRNP